jgi:hypothetical protein
MSVPLVVGIVVSVARPEVAPRWVGGLERWVAAKRAAMQSKRGYLSRWLVRPWLGGLDGIRLWTEGIKDEYTRYGVRAASYLYFSSFVAVAAYFAFIVTVVVILFVVGFLVLMWLLGLFLGSEEEKSSGGAIPGKAEEKGASLGWLAYPKPKGIITKEDREAYEKGVAERKDTLGPVIDAVTLMPNVGRALEHGYRGSQLDAYRKGLAGKQLDK